MDCRLDFYCFLGALGSVFLVFCALKNKLRNTSILGVQMDPETMIWRGGSTQDLDPENS